MLNPIRVWALVTAIGVAAYLVISCDNSPGVKESIAKLDEPCTSCDYCCTEPVGCCQCGECMDSAYDPDTKEMLVCASRGMWDKRRDCPGGGRVWCEDGRELHISCKDATGKEWNE